MFTLSIGVLSNLAVARLTVVEPALLEVKAGSGLLRQRAHGRCTRTADTARAGVAAWTASATGTIVALRREASESRNQHALTEPSCNGVPTLHTDCAQ